MPLAIKPRQTVLFIGDSITDCGRRDGAAPLGNGYVRIISELLRASHPAMNTTIINKGISGNTVPDLEGRWYDDVIRFKPDWVSVKIGINDLHRYLGNAQGAFGPEDYAAGYDRILGRVAAETNAKLILIDPFYISQEKDADSQRGRVLKLIPKYIATVEKLARKYKAKRVRTHDLFQKTLQHCPADALCPEPVHPYASGHTVIAHGWLKAMGW
mgnify:FL=1